MNFERSFKDSPLFLLPKIDLANPNHGVILKRLNLYGKLFQILENNPRNKLWIAVIDTRRNSIITPEYPNLKITVAGCNTIDFFLKIFKMFPNLEIYPRTLIAGDPIFGFLSALMLKIMKTPDSHLQIQFHGDVYSRNSVRNFKSLFRFLVVRISLRFADSVRVVSNFQISELRTLVKSGTEFIVAPIPINFQKIPINPLAKRSGIGFVGRLHNERGIKEFISIIRELRDRNVKEFVYVIGDGNKMKYMLKKLEKFKLLEGIFFLGNLEEDELRDKYSKLKVILSCAPVEGYGLTLREGALSGVEVVARKSSGSVEALNEFRESLHLYETINEAVYKISELLNKSGLKNRNSDEIESQKIRDQNSLLKWVATW